ncbi:MULTISPECIES: hypothetical protein [Bacillaceae]|jgi:hypothetical protein|uniref:Uncharacterized protein n=1 Tax=Niallia alba TaxID=2729105 RepID=A0A7Y0KDH1_9BACI|nr:MULTISPECIES: hypothetical protein [Bacillaceae]EOR20673.1 hypothetical protein A499_24898 [Niallia nealsonii AAU1]MCM3363462.1 hypothetical protein [Niallia sp. MER TA 168]NMO79569.1 hypothetical protein [Niallia alba]
MRKKISVFSVVLEILGLLLILLSQKIGMEFTMYSEAGDPAVFAGNLVIFSLIPITIGFLLVLAGILIQVTKLK